MEPCAMENNLPMPLSLSLVLCQCAILLVLFEGIVCPDFEFAVENFSVADIYGSVEVKGSKETRHFIFKKGTMKSIATNVRQHVVAVPLSDILDSTIRQEGNDLKVVSFSTKEAPNDNFNIKFKSQRQAHYFATHKDFQSFYSILWARIYSNWQQVIMVSDYLDDDDIGFKLIDYEDYPNLEKPLCQQPYFFKRSDIKNAIRTRPPQTLYLRSTTHKEDYEIKFRSTIELGTFLELFPNRMYDDSKTKGYYIMPYYEENFQ